MRFFAYQFLTSIGSTSFVSIIVIGIRRCVLPACIKGAGLQDFFLEKLTCSVIGTGRQFFRNKFDYMVQHDEEARNRVNQIGAEEVSPPRCSLLYRSPD